MRFYNSWISEPLRASDFVMLTVFRSSSLSPWNVSIWRFISGNGIFTFMNCFSKCLAQWIYFWMNKTCRFLKIAVFPIHVYFPCVVITFQLCDHFSTFWTWLCQRFLLSNGLSQTSHFRVFLPINQFYVFSKFFHHQIKTFFQI